MLQNKAKIEKFDVPKEVLGIASALKGAGFEAYLVGGCVRDLFMRREPKDWDVTTNARPEEITPLFPKTFYENEFGTVGVVNEDVSSETLKIIEVTPYRLEGRYADKRHPDSVTFTGNIEEDLKRRDFTINAIAYDSQTGDVIDPFGGVSDLARGVIKAVGNPIDRFQEDGLRILRAVRFHVELGFPLDYETEKAISESSHILKKVSYERIRDEFVKIIMSTQPMNGLLLLKKLNLLSTQIPELEAAIGIEQNKAHAYDVWTHLLKTVQHSADKKYPLHVRLAALLHDISKPETRRWNDETKQWTFYGHEVRGSRVTRRILERLKFSREITERVSILVRWHMFFSDTETITHSAVRRLAANVGKENVWDLMNVRICDRIGTGRPKENPYRLRKYKAMLEEVMTDPISLSMLKINGSKIMELTHEKPGPRLGNTLYALFNEVIENPKLNTEKYLSERVMELSKMSDKELMVIGEKGKQIKGNYEEARVKEIHTKYHVE